jgi:hypothetical protein
MYKTTYLTLTCFAEVKSHTFCWMLVKLDAKREWGFIPMEHNEKETFLNSDLRI